MYLMNNDFFDGFSVLVTHGESVINEKSYHLGSFAADALDIDDALLGRLNRRIPSFQGALQIFLSARSTSSAAAAQKELNEVWSLLEQFPVYAHLKHSGSSARHLMEYMREHPSEVDDMLSPGTARSEMLRRWLEKLTGFVSSVNCFIRDTEWMLENYFDDLPSRRTSAYADAYARYRFEVAEELRIKTEEQEDAEVFSAVELPSLSFSTQLSFVPITLSGKEGRVLAEKFTFEGLRDFLRTDLCRGMAAGNLPRQCHNCGRWFLAVGGYDTLYCTRVAPGETEKTCRKVGAHNQESLKNSKDFAQQEYRRVYNRLKARKRNDKITVDEWNRLVAEAQEHKERAKRNEISGTELKHIYDKI